MSVSQMWQLKLGWSGFENVYTLKIEVREVILQIEKVDLIGTW